MLWSLLKIVVFLAIAVALAYGVVWILDTPGEVRVAFGGREIFLTPIGGLIALALLLVAALIVIWLLGLLAAVVRFLLGDQTAVSRYFSRRRERRGLDALSEGLLAVAAGDPKVAASKAKRAEKLLNRPDVTRLLSAQAAELDGNRDRAQGYYKEMLESDRTRFVAVQGLMRQRLEAGDTDTALALARKAFALRPDNTRVLRTLFDLQSKKEDWAGARATLNASVYAKMLPRDVGKRRDAVLSLADARASAAKGETERAAEAALQANRLAPTLIPAADMAARVHAERDAKRRAAKTLTAAWSANPHPDLAAAFAAIEPNESPAERRRRFEKLTRANPDNSESRLLAAELALAAEDFPAARQALGNLAETEPTTRSLAIMAAIERGQGAPEAVVRGWLAKALGASRGPQWVCGNCNQVHSAWEPVCDNCGAFDTLAWKTPPHAEGARLAQSTMLPLIVGGPAEPAAADTPAHPPPAVVEDAELAAEPALAPTEEQRSA